MDRVTALAVTAVGGLVEAVAEELAARPEQTALVLGTGSGSVQSIMDFTRDSLSGERPYHVEPARFPNTVMNRAAGQSAIWHRIKGPNTTVAGGSLTGLLALNYALRLHQGRPLRARALRGGRGVLHPARLAGVARAGRRGAGDPAR
ncbi:hypothetical protein GCM10020295_36110 [Streptomyces cinereospinus]